MSRAFNIVGVFSASSRFWDISVFVVLGLCFVRSKSQETTCSCAQVQEAEGCEPNQICQSTGICYTENVAYGKAASMSSIFSNPAKGGSAGPACAAVNGRTGSEMSFLNELNTNCIHSVGSPHDPSRPGDWWEVDLGRNYTVTSVTVRGRRPYPQRVAAIWIYVDNQLCFKLPDSNNQNLTNYGLMFDVKCFVPLRGRRVKFSKEGFYDQAVSAINICEVQIWVCKTGSYGRTCDQRCSGHCQNKEVCDNYNGTCYNGCEQGFYGATCASPCGQCAGSGSCDQDTGHCPNGCRLPGFLPPLCQQPCTQGTYGPDCTERCTGHCNDNQPCNVTSGHCDADCKPGWFGSDCAMKCSANCGGNGSCNKTDGRCLSGCADRGTTTASCDTASLQGQDTLNGKNIAAIVGGVVAGVAVVVAVVVAIVFLMLRRRRRSRTKTEATLRRTGERRYMETPLQFEVFITTGEQQQSAASKPKAEVRPLPLHDDTDVYENCDLYANSQGTEAAARPANHRPTNDQSPDTALYANAAEIGEASGDQRPPKPHQEPQQAQPQLKPKPAGAENQPKSRQNESLAEAALFVAKPAALTAKRDDVVEEVDAYPESGDEVSPEDSDVYAVFKAKQPKLDAVQKYLVDRLASGKLCEEFSKIPKLDETEPVEAGNLTVNIKKNRFISVLPYDRNRVVLRDSYKEAKSTDYVNASYVMGNESNKRYIAAQGPVNNTVGDFWRLVWQERATHIVMLTNLTEVGKPKCFLYWPESEGTTTTFGPVMVKTNNIECRATFFIRHFTIKKLGGLATRGVTQYHFTSWPDHGVPTITSLVMFWRFVASHCKDDSVPLIVHCSAGVGRTGTYIGLDLGMKTIMKEGSISVLDLVQKMRKERTMMVQAVDQYTFLHKALLEAYTARYTLVVVDRCGVIFQQPITAETPNQRIDDEFESLKLMKSMSPKQSHTIAEQKENGTKNRYPDMLLLDAHIVFLTEHVPGRNQYINAVFKPTFRDAQGCILTQLPLSTTVVDFWRLVYGNDVVTIVSLCSPNDEEDKDNCQYWTREAGGQLVSEPYTIKTVSSSAVFPSLTSYSLQLQKQDRMEQTRSVTLLHYQGWTEECGGDVSNLLGLIDALKASCDAFPSSKLVIQCSDGVGKSGLFSVLCDVINRIAYDREIDVYMAVRQMQTVVPGAVTLAQFRRCYEVAQRFSREMNVYVNT